MVKKRTPYINDFWPKANGVSRGRARKAHRTKGKVTKRYTFEAVFW
jgi:hypothetical protein